MHNTGLPAVWITGSLTQFRHEPVLGFDIVTHRHHCALCSHSLRSALWLELAIEIGLELALDSDTSVRVMVRNTATAAAAATAEIQEVHYAYYEAQHTWFVRAPT